MFHVQQLYDLNVKSPLVVSGDVHFAEIMETSCGNFSPLSDETKSEEGGGGGGGLVELTTSGLTHAWGIGMGHVSDELNMITAFAMFLYQHIYPWGYQSKTKDDTYLFGEYKNYYLSYNFGEIEFDWLNSQAMVRILDGENGEVVIEKAYPFISLDMGRKGSSHGSGSIDMKDGENITSICHPKGGDVSQLRIYIGLLGCVVGVICLALAKPIFVYFFLNFIHGKVFGKHSSRKKTKSN